MLEQRALRMGVGVGEERPARRLAHSGAGRLGDPGEGQPVARVGDQGEGGQCVADLGAVTEPERAGDVHRDAGGHQRLLDAGGELVDAHEDAQRRRRAAGVEVDPGPGGDPLRLVELVVGVLDRDRVAGGPGRPQALVQPAAVDGDERVGRRQDGGRRAVVALQGDDLVLGEVAREGGEVLRAGGPAVGADRLVGVAEDHQVAVLLGQQGDDPVLRGVGVLDLVEQQVAPASAQRGPQREVGLERHGGVQQQVVEVEGRGGALGVLVGHQPRPGGWAVILGRAAGGLPRRVQALRGAGGQPADRRRWRRLVRAGGEGLRQGASGLVAVPDRVAGQDARSVRRSRAAGCWPGGDWLPTVICRATSVPSARSRRSAISRAESFMKVRAQISPGRA